MLRGHLWTIKPKLRQAVAPVTVPRGRRWTAEVPDERWGTVRISGCLGGPREASGLVVYLHGLGGSTQSPYLASAVAAAEALGLAWLLLDLRGADGSGEDLYHGGLTADLAAAVASPELERYSRLFVVGYSLGGHLALRYATEAPNRRVAAVAGISAPLALRPAQQNLDRPEHWIYRLYVLRSLRQTYRAVAARRELPTPLRKVLAARTIREWDRLTVVPRFGFADPEDYYRRASAAGRLDRLAVPALLVAAEEDPMVPSSAVRPYLDGAPPELTVSWVREGGHVGFPPGLELGMEAPPGVDHQVVAWLLDPSG